MTTFWTLKCDRDAAIRAAKEQAERELHRIRTDLQHTIDDIEREYRRGCDRLTADLIADPVKEAA